MYLVGIIGGVLTFSWEALLVFLITSAVKHWEVEGAAVQGHNIKHLGLITMGESWHNNHHAFPGSAKLGLHAGEVDPGWWVLKVLERMGLVWNIKLPEDLPVRPELTAIVSPIQVMEGGLESAQTMRID